MRVAVLTPEYPPAMGGLASYADSLAHSIADLGTAVTVITSAPGARSGSDIEVVYTPGWGLRDIDRIVRTMRSLKPDVVLLQYVPQAYGPGGVAPAIAILVSRLRKVSRIVGVLHELQSPWSWDPGGLVRALAHRLQLRWMVGSFDTIVVTNPRYAACLHRLTPQARVKEIPVGPTVIAPEGRRAGGDALRRHLGLQGMKVIGDLSVTGVGRRPADLLTVLAHQESNVRLLCIGALERDRPTLESLRAEAGRLGLTDRVLFTGSLPEGELFDYLELLDLCVHTEEHGASPRSTTLASALCAGIPVAAFRGDETPPWLEESAGVLLVDGHNADALGRLVHLTLSDSSTRQELAARALDTGTRQFSWPRLASRMLEAAAAN